ncbi:hypothetical protein ACP4OV_016882 [Aristida adscensionis]
MACTPCTPSPELLRKQHHESALSPSIPPLLSLSLPSQSISSSLTPSLPRLPVCIAVLKRSPVAAAAGPFPDHCVVAAAGPFPRLRRRANLPRLPSPKPPWRISAVAVFFVHELPCVADDFKKYS